MIKLQTEKFKCQTVPEYDTKTHWRLIKLFECHQWRLTVWSLRRSFLANHLLRFSMALLRSFTSCRLVRVNGWLREVVNGAGCRGGGSRWNFLAKEGWIVCWCDRGCMPVNVTFLGLLAGDLHWLVTISSDLIWWTWILEQLIHSIVASQSGLAFTCKCLSGKLFRLKEFSFFFTNLV